MSILVKCSIAQNVRKFISPKYIQVTRRWYDQQRSAKQSSSLAESKDGSANIPAKHLGEKIKENTKTASYMGIILLGVGVTGIMFFAILRVLFSSNSPNSIYTKALDVVANVRIYKNINCCVPL